jgi:hypothetical protein
VSHAHQRDHVTVSQENTFDDGTEHWPKGLSNVGNTCYANAALQCLLSTALAEALLDPATVPLFRKYSSNANLLAMGSGSVDSEDDVLIEESNSKREETLREQQRKDREKRKMHDTCEWLTKELTSITYAYVEEMEEVQRTSSTMSMMGWLSAPAPEHVVDPGSITRHPNRLSKCLRPYQQEDAHEFLRALLSTLVMNGHNKQLSSLFDGLLESSVTCQCCGRASLTRDRYMDLSLDINDPEISNLDDALVEYTKTELLDGDNMVFCQKCEKKQCVTKGLRLATAPSILVCHLKRFAFDSYGRLVRLHKKIDFPLQLEIGDFMSNLNKSRPPPYDLVGVLVHQGQTCASGHYLAFVKKEGDWFKCNDSVVTKVDVETVLNQQAYILMYEVAEMRERTCNGWPVRKQACSPHATKNAFRGTGLNSRGKGSSPPWAQPCPSDKQENLMQTLMAAEERISALFSELCCDSCTNTEPKVRRMKRRLRRRQKSHQRDDRHEQDDATVGTQDSMGMPLSSSSDSLHLTDNARSTNCRARTAPRQRAHRTHSFSQSEPGAEIDSPHGNKSTRSEANVSSKRQSYQQHNHHQRSSSANPGRGRPEPRPKRERSRSVHALGVDVRDLPPLPTPVGHRRAKSTSTPRRKYI